MVENFNKNGTKPEFLFPEKFIYVSFFLGGGERLSSQLLHLTDRWRCLLKPTQLPFFSFWCCLWRISLWLGEFPYQIQSICWAKKRLNFLGKLLKRSGAFLPHAPTWRSPVVGGILMGVGGNTTFLHKMWELTCLAAMRELGHQSKIGQGRGVQAGKDALGCNCMRARVRAVCPRKKNN